MKKQTTRKIGIRRIVAIVATLALFVGLAPTALASNVNTNNAGDTPQVEQRRGDDGRDRDPAPPKERNYTIRTSAGEGGKITGNTTVKAGGETTLNIVPDSGYEIKNVSVDGNPQGVISSYTFKNVNENHNLKATFSAVRAKEYTIRTSAGEGGKITGNTSVRAGGETTLNIVPDSGYEIKSVSVDGNPQGAISSYTFRNVNENHNLKATFSAVRAKEYTIRTSAGEGGKITGNTTVRAGGETTLNIVPDRGYVVRDVTVDGASVGPLNAYTFKNVTQDHTLKATFRSTGSSDPHGAYTIRTSAGEGGSINPGGNIRVDRGDSFTFKITPNPGYEVRDVSVDGRSVGAVSSYTFRNVRDDHTIKATFKSSRDDTRSYTITARAGDGGRISPSGNMSIRRGDSQSFTITPDRNYQIRDVIVDGRSVGAVSSYTFSRVSANHEIRAVFDRAVRTYNIHSSAGEGGSINPLGGVLVERYRDQTYTIRPDSGYRIKEVIVDGRSVGAITSYTFRDVDQDHSIKVTFEREKTKFELKVTEAYVTSITKNSAKLVVRVRGTYDDFRYQWQVKSGSSYKNISGGRYANFTYNGLESGKTYTVRCVVTDSRGNSVNSKALSFKTEKGSWGSSKGGAKTTYPTTGVITGGSVNIRRTASTSLSPLATAHKGDKFQVVDWVSSSSFPYGFYKIRWGTNYAYVAANYMDLR